MALGTTVKAGDALAQFTMENLKEYSAKAGKPVEPTDVQAALQSQRKKGPVWKSERSIYLLADSSIIENGDYARPDTTAWERLLCRSHVAIGPAGVGRPRWHKPETGHDLA